MNYIAFSRLRKNAATEGINASGQVTGEAWTAGNAAIHAFVTNAAANAMTDLGTLGGTNSDGLGINASGEVVGWADTSTNVKDGFLYSNGHMSDLNSLLTPSTGSLYTITSATGINDSGQIVANGYVDATGQDVAFLLNPMTPVPLPAAAWLMLSGLGGFVALGRRRRAA